MADYNELNLNSNLLSNNSPLANQEYTNSLKFDLGNELPLGGIDYTNMTRASKTYAAVVSLSKTQGAFTDFQEAFNFVSSQGGGRILVLPGTYNINKVLTIYNNTSMEGLQPIGAVLDFGTTSNYLGVANLNSNVRLLNLTFNNSTNTTGVISLDNAQRTRITNCTFGTNTVDIYSGTTRVLFIDDCYSVGAGNFFLGADPASNNLINNCLIGSTTGFAFKNFTNTNINNSLVSSPGTTVFGGTVSNSIISGNRVSSSVTRCVDLSNSGTIGITNNYNLTAINLGSCSQVNIVGNVISDQLSKISGINLIQGQFITINGNVIDAGTTTGVDGIRLATNCTRVAITGNSIRGGVSSGNNNEYGVNIADNTCNRFAVVGNIIYGFTSSVNNAGSSLGTVDINVLA